MPFVDLTHTIEHQMQVFPGETRPSLQRDDLPADARYITLRLETNMHTGTHMDAPMHVCADSYTIDHYEIDYFTGIASVLDVRNLPLVRMQKEWIEIFRTSGIVLFCTGHDQKWGGDDYYSHYPEFENEVALQLVAAGVRIAGFDSPSPDREPYQFHQIFLRENRFLIENLTGLSDLIHKKNVRFCAMPLKIRAEASLVRAFASFDD